MVLSRSVKIILIFLLVIIPLISFMLFAVANVVMNIVEPSNKNVVELDFKGRILDIDNEGNIVTLDHENKLVNYYNFFTEDKQVTYLINDGVANVRCYDSEKIVFIANKLVGSLELDSKELLGIYDIDSRETLLFEPDSKQGLYGISSSCEGFLNKNSQILANAQTLANGTVLNFCDEYEGLCDRESTDYGISSYSLDYGEKVVFTKYSRSEIGIIMYSSDNKLIFNESLYTNSSTFWSYSERWDSEHNVFILGGQSKFSESVFIFDPYEKTIENITFRNTPWENKDSDAGLICFSCGCSCYQYAYYFIMNDALHVHISGYGYKKDYQGIYRMNKENNWIKIDDLVVDYGFASYSPNSCFISWNKGGDQENPIQFTNICE